MWDMNSHRPLYFCGGSDFPVGSLGNSSRWFQMGLKFKQQRHLPRTTLTSHCTNKICQASTSRGVYENYKNVDTQNRLINQ